ncbi:MAG TPA: glycoside hydrolase family 3 N-terminal domain-containing protein [Bryobacteraceae bacterium]|nr:glycoside hydrolase family 3 N-terminal domain-containing protein [Bryobacteraceae bacterium]
MPSSRREFLTACSVVSLGPAMGAAATTTPLSKFDRRIGELMGSMTLDEKIGQMAQADQQFLKSRGDIKTYALGSVLSGGDSDPKSGNDLASWTDLIDECHKVALTTRLRIPILYGIDAVHGHNNVIGATIFPHNIGLGCARSAELVERAARITAEEVRATGANWAFAPCVAAPQDIRWGRTYEGFSESPDVVRTLAVAAVRGLQGKSLDDRLSVLACAKHYVADGGTTWGTGNVMRKGAPRMLDQGDAKIDEATLRKVHLPGYEATVKAGVASVMPSYNSWNGVKCSGDERLLTGILKKELGFEGFLISDYAALNQLPGDYKEQIATSVNAGMDMVMIPDKYVEFLGALKQVVQQGKIPMARIDDAVRRILRVKFAMGLMDPRRSPLADRSLHKGFGSAEHRAVARECVRASLVLLKNDNRLLPLAKNTAHIHVAGKSADDLGNQCGGWTIKWQGSSGRPTQGTTILEAVKRAVSTGTRITASADASGANGAPVAIAVIGELPYAEGFGDTDNLRLAPEDIKVVADLKNAGSRVVAVILSGRPVFIEDIAGNADAIVAAWLPGSEGDGVADVLFGGYKPSGKLSFTWPKMSSTSLHRGDAGYQTMFEFGYGLSF